MNVLKACVVTFLTALSLSGQTSRGTVPHPDPSDYSAHDGQAGVQIGASSLSRKDIKKNFAIDLNQCCVVVEVGLYPSQNLPVKIALDDFVLREAGKDTGVNPFRADVLAARLEPHQPRTDADHRAGAETESVIGYHGGTVPDPNTGAPRKGSAVYESQKISVGIPVGGSTPQPPDAAEADRKMIEAELKERMLPETTSLQPVAGYLYFPISKKPKGGYELVYTVNDKKIVLPLK